MADTKISGLSAASALTDADLIPIVQSGGNKSATAGLLKAYAQVGAVQGQAANGVISGCVPVYSGSALTFDVSAGTASINGATVTVTQQSTALAAADATNPRIDVIYVNDAGTVGNITGTAAASPSQPTVDPTSQLFLTFVQVPANASSISGITNENIYLEDTEWTTTVIGSGVTKNSTNNPYAGTKDVEWTNTPAASGIKFVRSSAMSFDGEGNLTFRIASKATWNNKRWLTLQWYLAGVAKGALVVLKSGTFGFDSSNTAYQLGVINKLQFAVPAGTNIDELRILDVGGAIGLYLDNIILQSNGTSTGGSGTPGITQAQADSRYLLESLILAPSDETTALAAGTGKITFRMPYAFTVTAVRASLTTAQTSGNIFTVDINESGTSIISTKLTIDNTEKTSTTAATPPLISDQFLADDAEITVDIDQIGDGTAKGLKVVLIGQRTL